MFTDIRTEWRLNDIERSLRDKAENYEVNSIRGNVDNLERTCRELRSTVDGLCSQLETCQERVMYLERWKDSQE